MGIIRWLSVSVLLCVACESFAVSYINTIYGHDERWMVDRNLPFEIQSKARSVAALFSNADLTAGRASYWMEAKTLKEQYGLCSTERFLNYPAASTCTGFLISPNRIATAGHCVDATMKCTDMVWIFDYMEGGYFWDGHSRVEFAKRNSYRCKRVLAHHNNPVMDFAVIELDRPVNDREPLTVGSHDRLKPGDPVFALGFPTGLPMVWSAVGAIRGRAGFKSIMHIDLNEGSSGSPIFDARDLTVVGLLVEGEEDYVDNTERGCRESVKCEENGCTGEYFMSGGVFRRYASRPVQ